MPAMGLSRHIKVLIVDDEKLIRWSLQSALSNMNLSVEAAENAEEALKMIDRNDYDIIITDLRMPGLDGLELIAKVRQKGTKARVILISAYMSENVMERAVEFGAFKCVNKPFGIDDFLGVVKEAADSGPGK